ncbi:hypothetical protein EauS123_00016 [Exiguobacterium phage vB_EauS-123]|nr:hypothetical protein EauS123_00016 [Exiguobacterium phage vB_EauS-123]
MRKEVKYLINMMLLSAVAFTVIAALNWQDTRTVIILLVLSILMSFVGQVIEDKEKKRYSRKLNQDQQ